MEPACHERGEVVGLVGEAECCKSPLAADGWAFGRFRNGKSATDGGMLPMRPAVEAAHATVAHPMIFQDPMSSLNPRMKVEEIHCEPAIYHG